ncbi:MAG TPA: hypothetical protein VG167_18890 [Verrucomicrobiae bacterium]|nr:hypothetical protein [Verrucomicrobiae bacterium]
MPLDYYPQKSTADLLVILASLQNRQTKGAITEVSAAGVRTVKEVGLSNSRVEVELRRVLYSLHLRQPEQYDDPYAARIRRVRARYIFS